MFVWVDVLNSGPLRQRRRLYGRSSHASRTKRQSGEVQASFLFLFSRLRLRALVQLNPLKGAEIVGDTLGLSVSPIPPLRYICFGRFWSHFGHKTE
jgi:hypothetical protein